jgi:hypothetical protein
MDDGVFRSETVSQVEAKLQNSRLHKVQKKRGLRMLEFGTIPAAEGRYQLITRGRK